MADSNISREIYQSTDYLNWEVNSGDKTIHARRLPGKYRNRHNLTLLIIYGVYFLLPYITWGDRQAVLLDIPGRKFYIFNATVWPQDLWILALILLFCFVLLFAMTSVYGRIFCGFACPQTAWTSFFTWIENLVEGSPTRRIKLEQSGWTITKIYKKILKHTLWLGVCTITAVTFIGYFSGIYHSWHDLFTFSYNNYEWVTFIFIINLFYMNSGFVREQVCMWVCPYARIQGVITDSYTRMVTYISSRGEPRNKFNKQHNKNANSGDCIDCNMCVSACPTGVDIRKGQQLGCINCGFCVDACDLVMKKIHRSTGLIKFVSEHEIQNQNNNSNPILRSRPIFYSTLTMATLTGILLGLVMKSSIDLNVRHERNPVYTIMSDGSIQNTYHLQLLNKSETDASFKLEIKGMNILENNASDKIFYLKSGEVKKFTLRVKVSRNQIHDETQDMLIILTAIENPNVYSEYRSMFIGPKVETVSRL